MIAEMKVESSYLQLKSSFPTAALLENELFQKEKDVICKTRVGDGDQNRTLRC